METQSSSHSASGVETPPPPAAPTPGPHKDTDIYLPRPALASCPQERVSAVLGQAAGWGGGVGGGRRAPSGLLGTPISAPTSCGGMHPPSFSPPLNRHGSQGFLGAKRDTDTGAPASKLSLPSASCQPHQTPCVRQWPDTGLLPCLPCAPSGSLLAWVSAIVKPTRTQVCTAPWGGLF